MDNIEKLDEDTLNCVLAISALLRTVKIQDSAILHQKQKKSFIQNNKIRVSNKEL